MHTRTALIILLAALTITWLTGCGGGGMSEAEFALTGTVFGPAFTRGAASQISYDPAFDYMVYVADPVTLEKIGNEVRTNYRGEFSLRAVPAHGDILIVAERDGITLRACVSEADRIASPRCHVSPDTTVATSAIQRLRRYELPEETMREMYKNCLAYQTANRFAYGHCAGSLCDLTSTDDVDQTAGELLRISTNDAISLALQNREVEQCRKMVALCMCDAALNGGYGLKLTVEQQARLAERTAQGDIWVDAEAAVLLGNAGITLGALPPPVPSGDAIQESDVAEARLRLKAKYPALAEGDRPKVCAAELFLLCCQKEDVQTTFLTLTQQQLDALVDQVAPAVP